MHNIFIYYIYVYGWLIFFSCLPFLSGCLVSYSLFLCLLGTVTFSLSSSFLFCKYISMTCSTFKCYCLKVLKSTARVKQFRWRETLPAKLFMILGSGKGVQSLEIWAWILTWDNIGKELQFFKHVLNTNKCGLKTWLTYSKTGKHSSFRPLLLSKMGAISSRLCLLEQGR